MKNRKNKLTNFLKTGILFFGISLLLWNCEQEEISIETKHNPLDYMEFNKSSYQSIPFQSNNNNTKNRSENNVDLMSWATKNEYYFNPNRFVKAVDSSGNEAYAVFLRVKNTPNTIFYNLVVPKKSENNFVSNPFIVKYELAQGTVDDYKANIQYAFKGSVTVFTLDNFKTDNFKTDNLKAKSTTSSYCIEKEVKGISGSNNSSSSGGGGRGIDNNNSNSRNNSGFTSYYTIRTISSSGGGGSSSIEWGVGAFTYPKVGKNEFNKSSNSNTVCPDDDVVTPILTDDDCPNGRIVNGECVEEEDDKIFNELTGKDKCIFNELKKLGLFKSTIKKFENSSNYNLTIKNGNCNNTNTACTDGNDIKNGNITVTMEIVSGTLPLEYAATLLHEGIHAELFKYVDEHQNGIDPNNRENLLYHYFEQKKIQKPNLVNSVAQHQHMADKYVRPIAEAIRQLDNNQYSLDYYMGYGWDGLRTYGYDGYYDSGNWVSLNKDQSTEYYKKQKIVNDNTKLKGNECK
jgi:hypothetical protein